MNSLIWIIVATLGMGLLSLVGVFSLFLQEGLLKKMIYPLVAFSAGALLGGAMLHMLPEAIEAGGNITNIFVWTIIGFSVFFLLEQFIHWHHCHKAPSEHKHPVTYLILIADSVHNFLDGATLAGAFLVDTRLGLITFLIIAAHEIPQELGDFGVLVHGGWEKGKALLFNLVSGLTALVGGLAMYFLANFINVVYVLPFAAGSFIYIASSDLIPEIKNHEKLEHNLVHFGFFILGIALLLVFKIFFKE